MSLFPMFVKLGGRLIVVVGGGGVAEAKIGALLSAGPRIRVVAPSITQRIAEWARFGNVEWAAKQFATRDLDDAFMVVAATSAAGVNEAVFRAAEQRGILCNAVDDIEHCHFYFGAVVQRGDLQIAISTNGNSPALAQRLRKELEAQFGPEYEAWLERLGAARDAVRAGDGDSESKRALLHEMASRSMFERFVLESTLQPEKQGTT